MPTFNMFLEITDAQYVDAYKIWGCFNNGECRIFDFATIIEKYPVFEPLKDIGLLKEFRITDTIEWLNGKIDVAPEYLYEHGVVSYPNKETELGSVADEDIQYATDKD